MMVQYKTIQILTQLMLVMNPLEQRSRAGAKILIPIKHRDGTLDSCITTMEKKETTDTDIRD